MERTSNVRSSAASASPRDPDLTLTCPGRHSGTTQELCRTSVGIRQILQGDRKRAQSTLQVYTQRHAGGCRSKGGKALRMGLITSSFAGELMLRFNLVLHEPNERETRWERRPREEDDPHQLRRRMQASHGMSEHFRPSIDSCLPAPAWQWIPRIPDSATSEDFYTRNAKNY